MRLLSLLLLLPLSLADQVPLAEKAQGWFDKAKSYIPNPSNPVEAAASAIAGRKVERINIRNYERKLSPKLEGEEEWMVYLTGGNKSCLGKCGRADVTWNESVPLLSTKLHLGRVDCEKDEVMCTAWSAGVPSIWHFLIPSASTSESDPNARTQIRMMPLNFTTVAISDITSIPSTSKSGYLEEEEYTGALHPIDGSLAKMGLLKPLGYLLYGVGNIPSWAFMIGISFISRNIMSRRMTGRGPLNQAPGQPGAGGAAPQAAAAPPASPNRAAAGAKKRK